MVFDRFYHGNKRDNPTSEFTYTRDFGLRKFLGSHPQIMSNWIEKNKNPIDLMKLPLNFKLNVIGLWISEKIENLTGYRIGEYKNYYIV